MKATRTSVCVALLGILLGCGSATPSRSERLTGRFAEESGARILHLSHSPAEVAAGVVAVTTLQSDLRVGGSDTVGFGSVGDVAALDRGRFAVFDRMEKHIVLFDSTGRVARRIGREGAGPGEFKAPLALAGEGGNLVAWQDRPTSTFTVLDTTGKTISTGRATVSGDWSRPRHRWPLIFIYGPRDQSGPEDVTRRLEALGDGGFVHLLELNEVDSLDSRSPQPMPAPMAHLIRYGPDAEVHDTLAVLAGTPVSLDRLVSGVSAIYSQPLYSGRPVWTIGDGWYAVGHGDSSAISVRWFSGAPDLHIRWPSDRAEITMEDRIHGAKWLNANQALSSSASRRILEGTTAREIERGMERDARETIPFAQRAPTVTALYGYAKCLFISGFSPSDWPDGTSLTWAVIDVAEGKVETVIRIPPSGGIPVPIGRRGAAVKDFANGFAFIAYRDGDGEFHVERFPLPPLRCDDLPGTALTSTRILHGGSERVK